MPVLDTDDTSTNEEALDTDDATSAEEALENSDISFDDVEDDDTEESEDFDDTDEAATDSDDETEEESDEDEGNQPRDERAKEEDTPPEDDVKKHNDEMARRRIAEREARQTAKQNQQHEYLSQAEDARDLAVRQLQVDAYNNRVEGNLNRLENGLDKAYTDIDLFRTGSPEQLDELARTLEDYERMYIQRDANGDPIVVNGDVYQFLKDKADSIKRLTDVGARIQTKAKSNTKSRTDTVPTRSPKEAKKDADLDAFDEEANRW